MVLYIYIMGFLIVCSLAPSDFKASLYLGTLAKINLCMLCNCNLCVVSCCFAEQIALINNRVKAQNYTRRKFDHLAFFFFIFIGCYIKRPKLIVETSKFLKLN